MPYLGVYLWMIAVFVLLPLFIFWAHVYVPQYSRYAIILRMIGEKLYRERPPVPREILIQLLSEAAKVPLTFAETYMESLCDSYDVAIGYILPKDRFEFDLSIEKEYLPRRIRGNLQDAVTDGGALGDFVTYYWRSDLPYIPGKDLERIARLPHLTVSALCQNLYNLEYSQTKLEVCRNGEKIMGLDSIELVMRVEETFDVKFSDQVLEETRTVGDLYLVLLTLLHARMVTKENCSTDAEGRCVSSRLFYRIRRFLVNSGFVSRKEVRVDQPLERLIPWWRRREFWKQFQKETEYRLPRLRRPGWMVAFLIILLISVFFTLFRNSVESVIIAMVVAICLTYLAGLLVRPLDICFPSDIRTVRNLIEMELALNLQQTVNEINRKVAANVWETLQCTIADVLGLHPRDIKRESSWYDDLALD